MPGKNNRQLILRHNRTVDVQRAEDLFDDDDAEVGPRQYAGINTQELPHFRRRQPPQDPTDIARVFEHVEKMEKKVVKQVEERFQLYILGL